MPIPTPGKLAFVQSPIFDAFANDGKLSPDSNKILFTRGRTHTRRKGYVGPAAAQLWFASLEGVPPSFQRISPDRPDGMNIEYLWPNWVDNKKFLFIAEKKGTRNLYSLSFNESGKLEKPKQLTHYSVPEDHFGVQNPVRARNAGTVVFRHGFDLYQMDPRSGNPPRKIEIVCPLDVPSIALERRTEKTATAADFTPKGKEIVFSAGGDLWVMDLILSEPIRLTHDAVQEREPLFSPDGKRIYFISDREGFHSDIWYATKKDPKKPWFLQKGFAFKRLTNDAATERSISFSPDGKRIAYLRKGDLIHTDLDGGGMVLAQRGWDQPEFEWSPDGKYFVLIRNDQDFNRDVRIIRSDGGGILVNLSRHPDLDMGATWSPDGTKIAWVGRREEGEMDIFYANLSPKNEEETERDRKVEKALKAFQKKSKKGTKKEGKATKTSSPTSKKSKQAKDATQNSKPVLDLPGAWERVHRIALKGSRERNLFFSKDGKTLFFNSQGNGRSGYYSISFPKVGKPKSIAKNLPRLLHRLKNGSIVGLNSGSPALIAAKTLKVKTYPFKVNLTWDWRERRTAIFRQAWSAIGEMFYDPALNNRDWKALGDRYAAVAPYCLSSSQFSTLVNEMLGELNGSHLGYRRAQSPASLKGPDPKPWKKRAYDLGLRYDRKARGPGLLIKSVIYKSPAWQHRSKILPGERLLEIQGKAISPNSDIDSMLIFENEKPIQIKVSNFSGASRTLNITPKTKMFIGNLLYDDLVRRRRKEVEESSGGTLGYVHIRGMNWSSFNRLEAELFSAGSGKEGLLIDVRDNGGGFTADHILTILCQPSHALTLPRGGTLPGYPQDRRIYASWTKPIVLLCNENSFSNAEILSHAVKSLDRGKIVGERTAGGVISTGGTLLLDGSFLRLPFRGWFIASSGQDMELNGCMPDFRVPAGPEAEQKGFDSQLLKAIQVGMDEVAAWKSQPHPKLIRRSQRK
jgi:tricorn protease